MDSTVIVIGNLTADPDLAYTPNGTALCRLGVAVTRREHDGDGWRDGETSFYDVVCWRDLAENVAESLHKGDRSSSSAGSGSDPGRPPRANAARRSRSTPKRYHHRSGGREEPSSGPGLRPRLIPRSRGSWHENHEAGPPDGDRSVLPVPAAPVLDRVDSGVGRGHRSPPTRPSGSV